jgi:hypothetical protein
MSRPLPQTLTPKNIMDAHRVIVNLGYSDIPRPPLRIFQILRSLLHQYETGHLPEHHAAELEARGHYRTMVKLLNHLDGRPTNSVPSHPASSPQQGTHDSSWSLATFHQHPWMAATTFQPSHQPATFHQHPWMAATMLQPSRQPVTLSGKTGGSVRPALTGNTLARPSAVPCAQPRSYTSPSAPFSPYATIVAPQHLRYDPVYVLPPQPYRWTTGLTSLLSYEPHLGRPPDGPTLFLGQGKGSYDSLDDEFHEPINEPHAYARSATFTVNLYNLPNNCDDEPLEMLEGAQELIHRRDPVMTSASRDNWTQPQPSRDLSFLLDDATVLRDPLQPFCST